MTRWLPWSFTNPVWHSDSLYSYWSDLLPLCFHLFQFPLKLVTFCRWLSALFLLISWVIRSNQSIYKLSGWQKHNDAQLKSANISNIKLQTVCVHICVYSRNICISNTQLFRISKSKGFAERTAKRFEKTTFYKTPTSAIFFNNRHMNSVNFLTIVHSSLSCLPGKPSERHHAILVEEMWIWTSEISHSI